MLLTICAILPLFYGVLASPSADQYFDNLLSYYLPTQVKAHNLEPVHLSDFSTEFQDKVAIIGKVNGKANYTDGQMTGLSKIQRMSACGGPTYRFGQPFINCTIGFQHIQTSYNGKMKYGKMPVVSIKGKGNVTTTTLFVEISPSPAHNQPTVTNFYFQQIGVLSAKFTGLGSAFNKFLKVLEEGYKSHVLAQATYSIQQRFRNALERAVAQVPMPR